MPTINNHDTSSTGTNIELRVFLDTQVAADDFKDAFHVYSHFGYRSTQRSFYTGWDSPDVPHSVLDCLDLTGVTENDARAWLVDDLRDDNWFTPRDIIRCNRDDYDGIWLDYLKDVLRDRDIDAAFDLELPSIGTEKYNVVGVTGYAQGDYAEVLYDPARFDDGTVPTNYFTNLHYGAPVYAVADIDGEEYRIDELLEDGYEWYGWRVAEKIRAAKWDIPETAIDWICDNLPEYPEYS